MNTTQRTSAKKAFYADISCKPAVLAPQFDCVHRCLRAEKRWMMWSLEWAKDKWTKIPKQIDGRNAASNNAATWTEFDSARGAYVRGGFDGIGFALGERFVGIDLDNARDPLTGSSESWAMEIIERLGGYCEVSPNGTGFKIFTRGEWRGNWHKSPCGTGEVEVYAIGRYFTVTGVSP